MFWVVRWVDAESDRDMATVVEAATRADAEAAAVARGIPYIFVARASQADIADSRRGRAARERTWRRPASRGDCYTCLGRPLGHGQLAALLMCGIATAVLHLRPLLPAILS